MNLEPRQAYFATVREVEAFIRLKYSLEYDYREANNFPGNDSCDVIRVRPDEYGQDPDMVRWLAGAEYNEYMKYPIPQEIFEQLYTDGYIPAGTYVIDQSW